MSEITTISYPQLMRKYIKQTKIEKGIILPEKYGSISNIDSFFIVNRQTDSIPFPMKVQYKNSDIYIEFGQKNGRIFFRRLFYPKSIPFEKVIQYSYKNRSCPYCITGVELLNTTNFNSSILGIINNTQDNEDEKNMSENILDKVGNGIGKIAEKVGVPVMNSTGKVYGAIAGSTIMSTILGVMPSERRWLGRLGTSLGSITLNLLVHKISPTKMGKLKSLTEALARSGVLQIAELPADIMDASGKYGFAGVVDTLKRDIQDIANAARSQDIRSAINVASEKLIRPEVRNMVKGQGFGRRKSLAAPRERSYDSPNIRVATDEHIAKETRTGFLKMVED